ncbi:PAS domain S-box protein [Planctomycetota bacterium]
MLLRKKSNNKDQVTKLQGSHSVQPSTLNEIQRRNRVEEQLKTLNKQIKTTNQKLADERNLLHTLINSVSDYLYAKDSKGLFTVVNEAAAHLMGAESTDQLIGKTDFDFYSEQLASEFYADEQKIVQTGQPLLDKDETNIDSQGKKRYILTNKVPLRDSEGNIIGLVGTGHDITERKLAEEKLKAVNQQLNAANQQLKAANQQFKASNQQLRASEETLARIESIYRRTIENARGVPYQIRFSDYKFEFVGSGCEELFGIESEKITPADIIELYEERIITNPNPSKNHLGWFEAIERGDDELAEAKHKAFHDEISRGETPDHVTVDFRIRLKNGLIKWMSDNVLFLRDPKTGKVTGSLGIYQDITERKLAEQQLADERNLLRTLINNVPDYLYAKDTQSRFIVANQATANIMRAETPEQLIGKTDFDFYPEELVSDFYSDEQKILSTGEPLIDKDEPNIDQQGNKRYILTTKIPLHDSRENIIGLVGTGHDITERKLAEEKLKAMNQQLNAANQQLQAASQQIDANNQQLKASNQQLRTSEAVIAQTEAIYRQAIENAQSVPYQLRFSDGKYDFMGSDIEPLVGISADEISQNKFNELIQEVIVVSSEGDHEQLSSLYLSKSDMDFATLREYSKSVYSKANLFHRVELRIITPKGQEKWLSDSTIIIFDERTAREIGTLGILQDITISKRKQKQLQDAKDQLELTVKNRMAELRLTNEQLMAQIAERKHAEDILRQGEKRYRQLVDTMNEGLSVSDENYVFTFVNSRFAEMLGYSPNELIGRHITDFFDDENKKIMEEQMKHRHRGQENSYDITWKKKDGQKIDTIISPRAFFDQQGNFKGSLGILTDITDRKRAERQVLMLNQQLEQRVTKRTEQLTTANKLLLEEVDYRKHLEKEIIGISERERKKLGQELHDSIGQQFTGIAFMLKVLETRLAKTMPQQSEYVSAIAKLAKEATEQSRAVAKGLHPIDLSAETLTGALHELAATTEKLFAITCTFDCDQNLEVDDNTKAVHLYRITQEAINNAIKHGKPKQIWIRLQWMEDKFVLSIENDGLDFPEEPQQRKTGMGLHIMNHRADIIGATLDIHKPSKGGTIVKCIFSKNPERKKRE